MLCNTSSPVEYFEWGYDLIPCFHVHVGTSVAQWKRAGLLVNMSSDQSCTRGLIYNKFISLSQIVPDLVYPNNAESGPKTQIILFSCLVNFHISSTRQTGYVMTHSLAHGIFLLMSLRTKQSVR